MQNKKYIAIPMLVVFALLLAGFAYAHWSENLYINGTVDTSELDWEIVEGYTSHIDYGNDLNASYYPDSGFVKLDKDVGSTTVAELDSDDDGDLDTITVTLSNVYPWYGEHIAFRVHNNGEIALKIWKVVFKVDDIVKAEIYKISTVLLDLDGDGKNDTSIWWGNNFGLQLEYCDTADISFDIIVLQDCPQGSTLTFTIEFVAIQWNEYYVP